MDRLTMDSMFSRIGTLHIILCLTLLPLLVAAVNPPVVNPQSVAETTEAHSDVNHVDAIVDISYVDHRNHSAMALRMKGYFGLNSRMVSVHAEVIHVRSKYGEHDGCGHILDWNIPVRKPWIGLVARGECSFQQKINNLYKNYNVTAVVVYNNVKEDLFIINHEPMPVVTVMIKKDDGEFIADLFDNGIVVSMTVTSEDIMKAEKAAEDAQELRISTGRIRRSRTVLAVSVLIIAGATIGLLVLLVHAIRTARHKGHKKSVRNDGNKKSWPALNTA